MSETKKHKKSRTGTVVSNKIEKSIVVRVDRTVKHQFYGKYVKTSVKYLADDPENTCKIGDIVKIEECRPLSKKKRWRLRDIIRQAV